MDEPKIKISDSRGLLYVPLKNIAKRGDITKWKRWELLFTLSLLSLRDENNQASPSIRYLTALCEVKKDSLYSAIKALNGEVFDLSKRKNTYGLNHNVYSLRWKNYEPDNEYGYFSLGQAYMLNGVLSTMTESCLYLYCVYKAFSYPGVYAESGFQDEEALKENKTDFDFIPDHVMQSFGEDEKPLTELCGISEDTLRISKNWLTGYGLLKRYEGEAYQGYALPNFLHLRNEEILKKVSKAQKENEDAKNELRGKILREVRHHKKLLAGILSGTKRLSGGLSIGK